MLLNSLWDSGRATVEGVEVVTRRRRACGPRRSTASFVFTPDPFVDERGWFTRTLDLDWCRRRRARDDVRPAQPVALAPRRPARTARPRRAGRDQARAVRPRRRRRPRRRHPPVVADVPPRRAVRARRRDLPPPLPAAVRRPRLPGRVRRGRRLLPALATVRAGRRPGRSPGTIPSLGARLADRPADRLRPRCARAARSPSSTSTPRSIER